MCAVGALRLRFAPNSGRDSTGHPSSVGLGDEETVCRGIGRLDLGECLPDEFELLANVGRCSGVWTKVSWRGLPATIERSSIWGGSPGASLLSRRPDRWPQFPVTGHGADDPRAMKPTIPHLTPRLFFRSTWDLTPPEEGGDKKSLLFFHGCAKLGVH
jgi:hypothetical protein